MTKRIDLEPFLMALRLRRRGIIYPDVEAVFGEILLSLVQTATRMLIKEEADMLNHRNLLLSEDSQQQLALCLLQKLDCIDTAQKSHLVFSYVKNIVQSRAKNLVRDTYAQKRDARKSSRFEDLEVTPLITDFYGEKRLLAKNCKVNNNQRDLNTKP